MKKTVCFLFAVLFLLASCNGAVTGNGSSPDTKSELSDEQPPIVYDIVYYRFYYDAATSLLKALKEKTGLDYTLIRYEPSVAVNGNSIVIGQVPDGTADRLCNECSGKDYGIQVTDGNIYVYGGSQEAVGNAVAYLIEQAVGKGAELNENLNYRYTHSYTLKNAKINGVELKDFDIIYADTQNEATYKNTANDFKAYLYELSDTKLSVSASDKNEGKNEIIIGTVKNRQGFECEAEEIFQYNEYRITVKGTKASVTGNNAVAVWHGCKALADYIAQSDGLNGTDIVINGRCNIVKVACLGDSITKGANSDDPAVHNYPAYLQRMLGYDYLVKKYGADGYSACFTDWYSVKKSVEYTDSLRFVPDVLLFMLGTNDCNPQDEKKWEGTNRKQTYIDSVNGYFKSYRDLNPNVQIFVSLPPILHKSTVWILWEEWARRVTEYAVPLNRQIAEEQNLPVIDMYSWSIDHPEVFPDGLHPKNATYKTYASHIYDEIKDIIITPDNINR